MTDAAVECPNGLYNVSEGNKTACSGMSEDNNCTSLTFPTRWSYTHVCGRVRGYMLGNNTCGIILERNDTDSHYADGVLITTSGSPREHLWTYAVGMNDTHCPCSSGAIFFPLLTVNIIIVNMEELAGRTPYGMKLIVSPITHAARGKDGFTGESSTSLITSRSGGADLRTIISSWT